MQHDRRLEAEAGGRHEAVAESVVQQAQPLAGAQRREIGGEFRRIDIRESLRGFQI